MIFSRVILIFLHVFLWDLPYFFVKKDHVKISKLNVKIILPLKNPLECYNFEKNNTISKLALHTIC